MQIVFPALGVTFAAFCVWLTVRIVNRRERWAKRTAAVTFVGLPVLYVLSFGPACWLCDEGIVAQRAAWIVYRPMTWLSYHGPLRVSWAIQEYANAWGDERRLTLTSKRMKCRRDSVSPIDYEVEYAYDDDR